MNNNKASISSQDISTLPPNLIEERLTKLANAKKNVLWIKSDLTTSKSNCFTRFFWSIVGKYFDCLRRHFYGVDLVASRKNLLNLKPVVEKDDRLFEIYKKALSNFNKIAPRHQIKLEDTTPTPPKNSEIPKIIDDDDCPEPTRIEIAQVMIGSAGYGTKEKRKHLGLTATESDYLAIMKAHNLSRSKISTHEPITFLNGLIKPDEEQTPESLKKSKQMFLQILCDTYGREFMFSLEVAANLIDWSNDPKEKLTLDLVDNIDITISSIANESNSIEELYSRIGDKTFDREDCPMRCALYLKNLNQKLFDSIDLASQQNIPFNELSFEQKSFLLLPYSAELQKAQVYQNKFIDTTCPNNPEENDSSEIAIKISTAIGEAKVKAEETFKEVREDAAKFFEDLTTSWISLSSDSANTKLQEFTKEQLVEQLATHPELTRVYVKGDKFYTTPIDGDEGLFGFKKILQIKISLSGFQNRDLTIGLINQILFNHLLGSTKKREKLGLTPAQSNIINALENHYKEEKNYAPNSTITFVEGKIRPLEDESEESITRAKDLFLQMLTDTYGRQLVRSLIPLYRIDKWYDDKNNALTLEFVKKILIGIAANVHSDDLKMLHKVVKDGQLDTINCSHILKTIDIDLFNSIKRKEFSDLLPIELDFLTKAYRTFLKGRNHPLPTDQALNDDYKTFKEAVTHYDPHGHDMIFMQNLDRANHLITKGDPLACDRYETALSEYLAKGLVYNELKTGMVIPMPSVEKEMQIYKVSGELDKTGDALVCHLLTPLNDQQSPLKSNTREIFLTFRGSWPFPNRHASGATWTRDFQGGGVGRSEFEARKNEIIDLIRKDLELHKEKDITLFITGHSLGAADAGRALAAVVEAIRNSSESDSLRRIAGIKVFTHNSPRTNPTVNSKMKKDVRELTKRHEEGISVPQIKLTHVRIRNSLHPDTVQVAGAVLVGADLVGNNWEQGQKQTIFKDAPFFERYMVKANLNEKEDPVTTHSVRIFNSNENREKLTLDVLSENNETDLERMEKTAASGFFWDERKQTRLKVFNWFATDVLRQLGRGTQLIAGTAYAAAQKAISSLMQATASDEVQDEARLTYFRSLVIDKL